MKDRMRSEEYRTAKLTMWDVIAIRVLLAERPAPPKAQIGRAFDVARTTVNDIDYRKQWDWLP